MQQLRLVPKISPKSEFAEQSKELADQLDKIIADRTKSPAASPDETQMTDEQRASLYVSQLVDLRCPQFSQPGDILVYAGIVDGKPDRNPPTAKLRQMQMAAVPALLKALEDDTPTRTIYHWRDFAHNRHVWRVSDFAWHILRDISKKELGNKPVVGFTFTSMPPEVRKRTIDEANQWFAGNKSSSVDDRMFGLFESGNPEDWKTAGAYFVQKKDKRAVAPLVKKIPQARPFNAGELSELAAGFDDASVIPVIQNVMTTAPEAADRIRAAIALWDLGDKSGIPLAIDFAKAEKQPYGNWEEPIWFLMKSKTPEGIDTLTSLVKDAPPKRAGEVVETITRSISGDLWGERRGPAGCVEICPVLLAGADRNDYCDMTVNNIKVRIKDAAARALAALREGPGDTPGRVASFKLKYFNQLEPDESKRDSQIADLKKWYESNKHQLEWDAKNQKVVVKSK